jgi:hypothetical protein
MPLTPALMSMLIAFPFLHGKPASVASPAPQAQSRSTIQGWRLTVRRDLFTGRNTCRLVRGRQALDRQVLVLRLPSKVDTTAAVYRVDWGAPMPAVDDRAAVASLGLALWRDDLTNPSGGLVRIPYAKVASAHTVAVEARPRGRIWTFSLSGLPAAVAAAKAANCG